MQDAPRWCLPRPAAEISTPHFEPPPRSKPETVEESHRLPLDRGPSDQRPIDHIAFAPAVVAIWAVYEGNFKDA